METCDIITPLVDDPYTFGRIAAANAISDVYAMGGRPVTAMNLAFFPACSLPGEILREILAGGKAILDEARVCLVGGHTVEDDELKYGLSVTGLIDPSRIVRNSGARPGDRLVLTKPLGSGIISTAIKGEVASREQVGEACAWMTLLNRDTAALMLECAASAATDITGFGLIGHSLEMARGAVVTFRLDLAAIPLMAGLDTLVAEGMVPAGCYRNRDAYGSLLCGISATDDRLLPLFDPQTSGGLLIALPPKGTERFLEFAETKGIFARPVGEVLPPGTQPLELHDP